MAEPRVLVLDEATRTSTSSPRRWWRQRSTCYSRDARRPDRAPAVDRHAADRIVVVGDGAFSRWVPCRARRARRPLRRNVQHLDQPVARLGPARETALAISSARTASPPRRAELQLAHEPQVDVLRQPANNVGPCPPAWDAPRTRTRRSNPTPSGQWSCTPPVNSPWRDSRLQRWTAWPRSPCRSSAFQSTCSSVLDTTYFWPRRSSGERLHPYRHRSRGRRQPPCCLHHHVRHPAKRSALARFRFSTA